MVVEQWTPTRWPLDLEGPERRESPSQSRAQGRPRLASFLAFGFAFGLVVLYAMRGGSYDVIVRQEYGLVIWWLIAVGVGLGLLPRSRPHPVVLVLLATLLAYAGWTALSLLWTESSEQTTAEIARVLDYLGLVTLLAIIFDRGTWRRAAMGIGAGAMFVCALAVASRLDPSAFPIDQAARVFRADRLDYPFGYWNAVGAWAAMSAAMGLAWSSHDPSRIRRALALAFVPVACVASYLTYSRATVGATALALLVVLAASRNRITATIHAIVAAAGTGLAILAIRDAPQIARATGTHGAGSVFGSLLFALAACAGVAVLTGWLGSDRLRVPSVWARRIGGPVAAALLVAALVVGPHFAGRAWHSFKNTGSNAAQSSNPSARLTNLSGTRYNLWKVALDSFTAHPADGTGAGTYQFVWSRNQRDSESVRNAHSLWLENMSDLGAPGLLLIIAVAVAALAVAITARRQSRRHVTAGAAAAMVAMFVVYLLAASVDWMWQSTAVTVLALSCVAVAGARLTRGRWRPRWPLRAVIVAGALVAGALQVPGLLSTAEIRQSQAAARSGNLDKALAWARDAASAEPWSASAYLQQGLVLESEGRLTDAASDVRHAISHERSNWVHWLILARIETERGHYRAALRDDNQAHVLGRQAQVFGLSPAYGVF
jgi:O-Antigen ligase